MINRTLGPYRILDKLGEGGMGEVYRARDPRLGREVAIKVLPAERLKDEHRRRRLLQEARTLSSLNHPHIVTIHEIESADDTDFMVMELVRGTRLDALIPRQGLAVRDLLRTAIPIADAVAAAHARGIVHRDLKPANVIVRDDGTVKVLDFGLARLMEPDEPRRPETATDIGVPGLTADGRPAGTVGYMAPEQAAGGRVDARSDVFGFGALLYEMATGRRAFEGQTTAEILAAVVSSQPPPPTHIVPSLPRELERLILRCLRKEPERRYQTMLDVRNELQDLFEESHSHGTAAAVPRHRRLTSAGALVSAVVVLASVLWIVRSRGDVQVPPMQLVPVTTLEGYEMMPTLSPDGSQVAFAWNGDKKSENIDVYVTMVGSPAVHRLTTEPAWDVFPKWSPDGRHIAFVRQVTEHAGRVYVTSPLGGPERKVSDFEVHFDRIFAFGHLSWSPDGLHILAARPSQKEAGRSTGIYLVPIDGGEPRALTTTRAPASDRDPAISPDGRRLAYLSCANCCWGSCDVMVVDLDSRLAARGEPRRVTALGYQMEGLSWTADGQQLVFGAEFAGFYNLWRANVDGRSPPERIEMAGFNARKPSIVANRLVFGRWNDNARIYRRLTSTHTSAPVSVSSAYQRYPAIAPDGRHITFCSTQSGRPPEVWLAETDGSNARPLAPGCASAWRRDGHMLAIVRERHIWAVDVQGGNLRRVTAGDPIQRWRPSWSGDGQWIYFAKVGRVDGPVGANIWRVPADGGPEEQVTRNGGLAAYETPDGTSLVYQAALNRSGLPIVTLPLTGGPSQQLVACAYGFTVESKGVYYYPCRPSGAPVPLAGDRSLDVRLIDPASARDLLIDTLPDIAYESIFWGPRVSPDGRTIVYTQLVSRGDDLMLIDNFR